MANQKVTANDIVVVDIHGRAHIQPKGNLKSVKQYNARMAADKRSKVFEFKEGETEVDYYIGLAKGGNAAAPAQTVAVQKLAESNQKLQSDNKALAQEKDAMATKMKQLEADLKAAKEAAAKALDIKPDTGAKAAKADDTKKS